MNCPRRWNAWIVNVSNLFGVVTVLSGLTFGQENSAANDADNGPDPGHSYHGEVFDEGPRQKAFLMEGTGNVTFPATTQRELAQKFINQGVGQLHGFWYFEAERSFRQAAAIDPDCATAYWGMAMANYNNAKRGKGFIKEAVARKDKASDREKRYIDALNKYLNAVSTPEAKDNERKETYLADLEDIALAYPDDLEAKAFICLQIYQNRTGSKIQSSLATNALAQEILAKNPLHPVHHYVIHLWDIKKPELGLQSASLCGQSAPSIAHMWHMPGHIYSKLRRYNDAIWQQEASARVDHAHMMRDRVLPDQIHNFAHNNEWLIRNLVFAGRIRDAVELSKNMIELPQHPKYNTLGKRNSSSYYGRLRLFATLNQNEMWEEMIQLCHSPYLAPTNEESEQIKRLRHLGRAYYRSGDSEEARHIVQEVENWKAKVEKQKLDAQIKAEEKVIADAKNRIKREPDQSDEEYEGAVARESAKEIQKAHDEAARPFSSTLRSLDKALEEFQGQEALAEGKFSEAYDLLKKAGDQDSLFLARVKFKAGDAEEAEKSIAAEVSRRKNETLPLAQLAYIQWKAGNLDAAKKTFEDLRKISGPIDLDTPVFARLTPFAKEQGLAEDWRMPQELASDVGNRPAMESLGPFRWQPSLAEPWSLADKNGHSHSLADYRGRPVVVVFYLGFGCLHCVEQLKTFAAKAEEFQKQGIAIVAISTESRESLDLALKNYNKEHTFAFPLLSDPEYSVFKAYRAYDDFENQPLHGTYLVDAEGKVRWHDISYEPFMDADFVLKEATRLLGKTHSAGNLITVQTLKPAAANPAVAEKRK